MKHYLFYIFILALFSSCEVGNNDNTFAKLNAEFKDSIHKNGAKNFEFQVDGLVPQESFFFNGKVKYLKYHYGPENGSIDYLIYFDLKTDSISKIIRRHVRFGNEDENFSDSIFVISNRLKKYQCFVNNKLTYSTSSIEKVNIDREFIKEMKRYTEKSYIGI